MLSRKALGLVTAVILALGSGLATQPAAANQCNASVFILSGVGVDDDVRQGFNGGFYGCNAGLGVETWYIHPGSTHIYGGSLRDQSGGSITIVGDRTVNLNWSYNDVRGRWESQTIHLPIPQTNPDGQYVIISAGGESVTYLRII